MYAASGGGLTTFSSGAKRTVLLEQFTNASCAPCAAENATFNPKLLQNASKLAVVKYQVWWPGKDPMYDYNRPPVQTRAAFYDVSGVPQTDLSGKDFYIGNFNTQMVDSAAVKMDTSIDIESWEKKFSDNSVEATVNVINKTAISANEGNSLKLFYIVTEEPILYTTPPGSNGETQFHFVMRKTLPDGNGLTLGEKNVGAVSTFIFKYKLTDTIKTENIKIVIFLQNTSTKSIKVAATYVPKWIEYNSHSCENDPIQLGPITQIGLGDGPYTYQWSPTAGLNNPNDSATMADPSINTKYVLATTDADGNTVVDSIFIQKDSKPVSKFSYTRGTGSKNVTFNAQSSQNWTSCKWIFHDGTIINGDPSNTKTAKSYPTFGLYDATLVVYSTCGTDTISKKVGIWASGIEDEIASGNLTINAFSSTDNNITVNVDAQKPVALGLKLTNLLGQIIWEEKISQFATGKSTKTINAENLRSGIYYLQFISPDSSPYTMKVVNVE